MSHGDDEEHVKDLHRVPEHLDEVLGDESPHPAEGEATRPARLAKAICLLFVLHPGFCQGVLKTRK